MQYSYSKNIKASCEETEMIVRRELTEVGFGVLTEISIKDAFKSKLGIEFKYYKILGACNPKLAHEAIGYENMVGILMPCNILIIDNEDGTTKVVFPKANGILDITGNKEIMSLSIEVDRLLESAFDKIY